MNNNIRLWGGKETGISEFRQIYKEAYEICLNVERVMDMFSKELYELDKNTVQYMIDEQEQKISMQEQ